MNVFSIIKLAQSGSNIISYVRMILNKSPDELAAAGIDTVRFDRLKNIASKNSMSELSVKDLAVLGSFPASLKTTDFNTVKKHAIDFVHKKTGDEFASASADVPPQQSEPVIPVVEQAPNLTPNRKNRKVLTPVSNPKDIAKATKDIKEFLTFEFLDRKKISIWCIKVILFSNKIT